MVTFKRIVCGAFLLLFPAVLTASDFVIPLHQTEQMAFKRANKLLRAPTLSVTQKTILTASRDPHDYVSVSIYWWPDPSKPNGLPYIGRDGQSNPETADGRRYDRVRQKTMADAVEDLALAYRMNGNEAYARKAFDFIRAWFLDPHTRMNPHLNYGQGKPGISSGSASGMIETVHLVKVVNAMNYLEKSPYLSQKERDDLRQWFKDYLNWLQTSKYGISAGNAKNNIGTWYDVQVAYYAHFTGQDGLARNVLETSKTKRIAAHILANGMMPHELTRTKSQQYSAYNLKAFILLAELGDELGVNLWDYHGPQGQGIETALDNVCRTLLGQQRWAKQDIPFPKDKDFATYLYKANLYYKKALYSDTIAFILTKK